MKWNKFINNLPKWLFMGSNQLKQHQTYVRLLVIIFVIILLINFIVDFNCYDHFDYAYF